ncbi:hypothetical protein GF420_07775 [candidate division GN15 bacterium]|nr:hypothetical protein [candidate division GN15 bacterium]
MSRILFFGIFITLVISFFGLLDVFLLRLMNREWWKHRWVRRTAWAMPLVGITFMLFWGLTNWLGLVDLSLLFALGTSFVFVLELGMVIALLVSGLVFLVSRLIGRLTTARTSTEVDQPVSARRLFIKRAAAAAPVIVGMMSVTGMARSFGGARVYVRPMTFASLPPEFDGFRILHISDSHLREYVTVGDIESLLAEAEPYNPDLVLMTGDIADDLDQLPTALSLASQLKATSGVFTSLGNHEYFRGVQRVRRIHDKSTVPLMVNESHVVTRGNARLRVAAIDDPRRMGPKNLDFFVQTIDSTLANSKPADFTVLMSHRPDAFDIAAERGIDLTLAGHTHGGQLGWFGRSVFEPYWPDRYLWGEYRKNGSQLYTSSGVGHWFPFRLGCPPEAPVIELRRA